MYLMYFVYAMYGVCLCLSIHVCGCTYRYFCGCVYTSTHEPKYVQTQVSVYLWVRACECVRAHASSRVQLYVGRLIFMCAYPFRNWYTGTGFAPYACMHVCPASRRDPQAGEAEGDEGGAPSTGAAMLAALLRRRQHASATGEEQTCFAAPAADLVVARAAESCERRCVADATAEMVSSGSESGDASQPQTTQPQAFEAPRVRDRGQMRDRRGEALSVGQQRSLAARGARAPASGSSMLDAGATIARMMRKTWGASAGSAGCAAGPELLELGI